MGMCLILKQEGWATGQAKEADIERMNLLTKSPEKKTVRGWHGSPLAQLATR